MGLPQQIFYSQHSIEPHFVDNSSVAMTIREILKNKIDPETIPPIRVIQDDNRWISLDNRRLFVFRNAVISPIVVIVLNTYFKPSNFYSNAELIPCKCQECVHKTTAVKSSKKQRKSKKNKKAQ